MTNLDSAVYDALGMIDDHTIVATWGGVDYDGTTGGLATTKNNISGGFLGDYDLIWATSLWKRAAVGVNELIHRFPNSNASTPQEGDRLTIDGTAYRIERIEKDLFTAVISFHLVNVAKMDDR